MQITGTITKIGEVQSFGNNGFTKRDVIIQTNEKYPQDFCIELHKDNTDLVQYFAEGEEKTFEINLRGKEWISPKGDAKYFVTLVAWRVVNDQNQTPEPKSNNNKPISGNEEDNLPF